MKKLGIFLVLISLTHLAIAQSAVNQLIAKAQAGDPKAQNQLGVRYRLGEGVEKDPKQAVEWYRKAAHSGYADAMFNLGTCYFNGDGVDIDDSMAFAYFLAAEEYGSSPATDAVARMQTQLNKLQLAQGYVLLGDMQEGKMVNTPESLPENYTAARLAFEKAGEWTPVALIHLAQMELDGKGAPPDPEKAKADCVRAADMGAPAGAYCVGMLYESGKVGTPDYQAARDWYLKAAKHAFAPAAYGLGNLYAKGNGVAADPVTAFSWYYIGAAGDVRAKAAFAELSQTLSTKDQSKGAKLAQKFLNDNRIGALTQR